MSIKSALHQDGSSKSPFLTVLPAEIRGIIYEILIAAYIIITDPRSGRICIAEEMFHRLPLAPHNVYGVHSKCSFESLPLACRQISREYQEVLKIACPKFMHFATSDVTRRDRAMSFSPSNIKQRLSEAIPNHILKSVRCISVKKKDLGPVIRAIEERFFSSLRRIVVSEVPAEDLDIRALQEVMNFRGFKSSEERPVEGVWNFDYDERMNEYMFYRKLSYAQSGLAGGLINPAVEAMAIRRMSEARNVEA